MSFNTKLYRLPLEAYTSEKWFKEEIKKIFTKTWQFVGFIDDFKTVGDHKCVNFGDLHLMIVLNEAEELSAIHTTCCHRGNRLEHVENNKIICPYHKWTYDLNGQVLGIPEHKNLEPFDKSDIYLKKGSVFVWKTMVFAHPDENASSFYDEVSGLEGFMGPHQPELLEEYLDSSDYLVHCNWKVFAENYMDGYHLPYLHAETLNMYDHKKQISRYVDNHWTFFEPLEESYAKNIHKYGFTPIDHVLEKDRGAYVHLVFPNLGISESESTWSVMQIIPLKVNLTLLTFRTKIMPPAKNKWLHKNRNNKPIEVSDFEEPLKSYDFMVEDMYVCEQIHRNMVNGSFNVGPLHLTKESGFSHFHRVILDYMHEKEK